MRNKEETKLSYMNFDAKNYKKLMLKNSKSSANN